MEKSIRLRRNKARARVQLRRRLAAGDVRIEQVSIAAAMGSGGRRPLILTKVKLPESDSIPE